MLFHRYCLNYMHVFNGLDRACWNYEDGCVLIGAQNLYAATGDSFYLDGIRRYMDRYVAEDGAIRHYEAEEYNLDRIPSGRPLFLLYEETGQEKYRRAIETLRARLASHPRTQSGSFWHKKIYPYQIWLDGLYMGLPFYLEYENRFGDSGAAYADVAKQFANARELLYDPAAGLYYHAYDEQKKQFWANPETGLSRHFWSRAMGWFLMALVDCWALLPAERRAEKDALAAQLREALDGMLCYQHKESGLFWQLTALPGEKGNYLESSASAMVAYTIFKGIGLGVLPEDTYRARGEAVLLGLATQKMDCSGGMLSFGGICLGAGLGPADNPRRDGSAAYYLGEPVVADEQKGAGVLMMAYAQWLALQEKSPDRGSGTPAINIFNGEYRL